MDSSNYNKKLYAASNKNGLRYLNRSVKISTGNLNLTDLKVQKEKLAQQIASMRNSREFAIE